MEVWLESGKGQVERNFKICGFERKTGTGDGENREERGDTQGAGQVDWISADSDAERGEAITKLQYRMRV